MSADKLNYLGPVREKKMSMQSDSRLTVLIKLKVEEENIPTYLELMGDRIAKTVDAEPGTGRYELHEAGEGSFYILESFPSSDDLMAHFGNTSSMEPEVAQQLGDLGVIESMEIFGNPEGKAKELLDAEPFGPSNRYPRIYGFAR